METSTEFSVFSKDLDERLIALAQDAVVTAAVLGSIGATSEIKGVGGNTDAVRVERIAQHAAGWRIVHVTVMDIPRYADPLIGQVIVRRGNIGQYASHAAAE